MFGGFFNFGQEFFNFLGHVLEHLGFGLGLGGHLGGLFGPRLGLVSSFVRGLRAFFFLGLGDSFGGFFKFLFGLGKGFLCFRLRLGLGDLGLFGGFL